jgi:hypothetical protein
VRHPTHHELCHCHCTMNFAPSLHHEPCHRTMHVAGCASTPPPLPIYVCLCQLKQFDT